MTFFSYLRSHLKIAIVSPVRYHLLMRDSCTGFDSVNMRSHLHLIRDSCFTGLTIWVLNLEWKRDK